MASSKDVNVRVTKERPRKDVIMADWNKAVAVSMAGLEPVPLMKKLGFCIGGVVLALILVIVMIILFATNAIDDVGFGVGFVVCLIVPCVLGVVATRNVQFYAERPSRVPRATFVDDGVDLGPNHSLPFRSSKVDALLETVDPAVTTLAELWDRNVRIYARSNCMGARHVIKKFTKVVELKNKDGSTRTKDFTKVILAPEFNWKTYAEVDKDVKAMARFITAEINEAAPIGGERPRHAGIYASTSRHWQTTAQACFQSGVALGTVYATLGADGLAYAAHLTEMSILFVEPEALQHVAKVMSEAYSVDDGEGGSIACTNLSCIKTIVVVNGTKSECDREQLAALEGRSGDLGGPIRVIDFDSAVTLGNGEHSGVNPAAPKKDDTAVIMFTSGSTGLPKGVQVLHRNLVACCAGLRDAVPGFNHSDVFIAYLPLAHILELAAELTCLTVGGSLGYGSPFTLTNASPMIAQKGDDPDVPEEGVLGDAIALRPTVLAGVPAVYEKVRKSLTARFAGAEGLAKTLWENAWATKSKLWPEFGLTPFFDGVLFDKVRLGALGGRVRVMLSGGGPITKDTQLFMNVVFNCPLGQGYGLTETCGGGTVFWPDDRSLGRAGVPIGSNDLKLVDWEEGGYTVRPNEKSPLPQGEICISGGNVTAGYYKNPEKTAESFVDEGGRIWFYTGDIGQFDPDGWLQIIDRKKDLVKLSRGEYVALGKVEAIAKLAPSILNLCVYGDSTKDFCVGVATINKDALPDHLKALHDDDLMGNKEAGEFVQKELANIGKKRLSKEEIPAKITVVGTEEWRPEDPRGLVTASMKLQRRPIYACFKAEIDAMYK